MEVKAEFNASAVHLEGFPDAIKAVEVKGEKAKQLADLTLHRSDLIMAEGCLSLLETLPSLGAPERNRIASSALWRQAVALFAKCFGKDARVRLRTELIYEDDPALRDAAQFFIDLRNKVFVHDANAFKQQQVLAPLNAGNKACKLEGLAVINLFFDFDGAENRQLLRRLIDAAARWLAKEFDVLRDAIKADLEAQPYGELAKLPAAQFRVPEPADMKGNRQPRPPSSGRRRG